MKKRISILLTLTLALVCCIFGQSFIMLSNAGEAQATTLTESYKVGDGAAIRIGTVTDSESKGYGIRFKATVSDNTKKYDMCIMPIDYYNYYRDKISDEVKKSYDYNIIAAITGETGRQLAIVEDCPYIDDYTIHGSIVNILENNLEREFTAIVYYVDDAGAYHFADGADDGFRSVADVASRAINSQAYADDDEVITTLKSYLSEDDIIEVALPDYVNYESNFFAYGSVGSDTYTIDLEKYATGVNGVSLERFSEYKAAGFNVLYSGLGYSGETWETSTLKKGMDLAEQVGLKVVVTDYRILNVYNNSDYFESDEALKARLTECIADYATHPAFYGINMFDEPSYTYAEKYGKVYKGLKKIIQEGDYNVDNPYLHCNLLPVYADDGAFAEDTFAGKNESFKTYLETFIDATKDENGNIVMDRLSIDVYPYREIGGLISNYYSGLQIFAETCRAKGVKTTIVLQSYSGYDPVTDKTGIKAVTVNDTYQQMNAAIAMGITDFSFYTYYAKNSMSSSNGGYTDTGSFLTVKGEKNNVYYYAKQAIKEAKAVTSIFGNYDYLGGKFIAGNVAASGKYTLYNTYSDYVGSLGSVSVSGSIAYVSEFKDGVNGLYGYAVFNPVDESTVTATSDKSATVTLSFGSGYDYVAEIYGGNINYRKLANGTYTKTLSVGDATYVIPLKSTVNTGIASVYGKAAVVLSDSEVYYQAEQSVDLYDLIEEVPNVSYSFAVNGNTINGRTYFVPSSGVYSVQITATCGSKTATATASFTANESRTPYYDRFEIIASATEIEWFDMSWATSYELVFDGTTTFKIAKDASKSIYGFDLSDVSSGKHTVTLKGILEDGTCKQTTKDIIYSPDGVKLVNADKIADGSYLNSTSGSVTYSSTATSQRSASFVSINSDFTDEFIKVRFTALGTNFADSGIDIGIRDGGTTTDVLSGWRLLGHNAHGLMLNYGQHAYMNRFNQYGEYTDVTGSHTTFKFASGFVTGKEYSLSFGIVGTGEDKVIHVILADENDEVLRYVTVSWAQIVSYAERQGATVPEIADSGAYTIYNSVSSERSFSYEIIPYAKLDDALNTEVSDFAYDAASKSLTWTAVTGASGYSIKIGDGEWINVGSVTSYDVKALGLVGEQTAKIRAIYSSGYCSKTTTLTFRAADLVPPIGSGDATVGDVYD